MNQVKIYTDNNINYAIFSIDIDDPDEAVNIIPIEFIKQFNGLIMNEYNNNILHQLLFCVQWVNR